MTAVKAESKVEPTSTQEKVDSQVSQTTGDSQVSQTPETKVQEQTNEDPNWKAFREARKKDRSEREAAERRASEKEAEVTALKAAMEAAFSKSAPSPQAYQQYYGLQPGFGQQEETEEQLLEKKIQAAVDAKVSMLERARADHEHKQYPQRLQQTFPDITQVLSQDNLDYLDYHYPEISKPLGRLQDGFDKYADMYRAVKKFVPNHANASREAARAEANHNKPKSISSPHITQPGEVKSSHIISDEKRAANWERMQRTLKGLS